MEKITQEEFAEIRAGGTVLEQDAHGEKVVRLVNGDVLKIFRRKRFISSAAVYPYSQRFFDNSINLQKLGFASVKSKRVFKIAGTNRDCVIYGWEEGIPLREVLKGSVETLGKFAEYLAEMHDKGVYFRSLHFANILVNDGGFILIDISDMKIHNKPLSKRQILRNFKSFLRYEQDKASLKDLGVENFLNLYAQKSSHFSNNTDRLLKLVKRSTKHPLNELF